MAASDLALEKGLPANLDAERFVLGAILALTVLIWKFGVLNLLARGWKQVWYLAAYRQWLPLSVEERQALEPNLHLAPAALAAIAIVEFSIFG